MLSLTPLTALFILMRTAHLIAGATWIGGSVIYLVVITPALRGADPKTSAKIGELFRRTVNVCLGVLTLTGLYLVFDRLTSPVVGPAYIIALVAKLGAVLATISLAIYQGEEARKLPSARGAFWKVAPRWILGCGLLTFALGATLTAIYEAELTSIHLAIH